MGWIEVLKAHRPNFNARVVFDACCQGISDPERRSRILQNAEKIEIAAVDYFVAGEAGTIHALVAKNYEPLDPASKEDFVWLYEQRLVNSKAGRPYYDQILYANRGGRCSLCNVREVANLDHHLPKDLHPVFAVTPDNLLPACDRCNKIKLSSVTPVLNTYFDDLGEGEWLKATIPSKGNIDFHVDPQSSWSSVITKRAFNHFNLFRLRRLYIYEAQRQLTGTRHLMKKLAIRGQPALEDHLQATAESWKSSEPNSWEAALYAALARSDSFSSGFLSE
jgi:hypothetical protein